MNILSIAPSTATSPEAGDVPGHPRVAECHGPLFDALLTVPAAIFVAYLLYNAKRSVFKLWNGRSYVMMSYYALLWLATTLNLFWSCLQGWQCSIKKDVAWNLLSLFAGSSILCLEISIMAFLLQESYSTGVETLARSFITAGIISGVDVIFKAINIFGFGVSLYIYYIDDINRTVWSLRGIHVLFPAAMYGYILFVHFSKWREKLPPRPAFHNYLIVMFLLNLVALLGCFASGIGAAFGIGLYNFTDLCYHSLYLPFLYFTFLAGFFQEEDFLLDNAYYAEMRDAGFFDTDWD